MKKIIVFLAAGISVSVFSQCAIDGNPTIKKGESEVYTTDLSAQCDECYQWSIDEGKVSVISNNKFKEIKLKANTAGQTTISVSAQTSSGMKKCSQTITITENENIPDNKSKCNISISDFKDVKVSDTVMSFFPDAKLADGNYKYTWTATYTNGTREEHKERIPEFEFSSQNTITEVKLKIENNLCYKVLTKTYNPEYWNPVPAKPEEIPQKKYEQVDYNELWRKKQTP
ncbi:MAG: hypothetical protein QM564_04515 [Bergeyella sp.]